jgi:hypothetical protein
MFQGTYLIFFSFLSDGKVAKSCLGKSYSSIKWTMVPSQKYVCFLVTRQFDTCFLSHREHLLVSEGFWNSIEVLNFKLSMLFRNIGVGSDEVVFLDWFCDHTL